LTGVCHILGNSGVPARLVTYNHCKEMPVGIYQRGGTFTMAQRVQVLLTCDIHGDDTPGTETVTFALDGTAYEIDVCDAHAAKLRDAFATYTAAARRASRGSRAGRSRRGRTATGVDPAAVRAWARSSGVKVSERGRISADILEQYAAAGH
jgi:hypothetical protein